MKKAIAVLLSVAMLAAMFAIPAAAEEKQISYYQTDDGTIKLFVSLGSNAYGDVMLTVFDKDNYVADEFSALSDEEKNALIEYTDVVRLNGGKAEFEFSIYGETGFYPYIISMQYNNAVIKGEKLAYIADANDVLSKIEDKSSAELKEYLDVNAEFVFGKTGIYTRDTADGICEAMADRNYPDIETALSIAFKVKLENELNSASTEDKLIILGSYSDILAYDKPEYKIFLEGGNDFKNDVVSLITGEFTTERLYEAVDLTALKNTSNYSEIKPILTRLTESTGLDLSDYFDLADTSDVDDALVGADCKNVTELKGKIKTAMGEKLNSGSGSVGSVSGGIKAGKASGIICTPTVEEDKEAENAVFTDLDGYDWAKPAIEILAKNGILNGKSSGKFAPGELVNREELVKMLVCIFDIYNSGEKTSFSDLEGHWSSSYIASAEKYGLVKGISADSFGAGQSLTREDMAVLCYRFMNAFGVKINTKETEDFADAKEISDYAVEAVKVLKGANIINGKTDGKFDPKGQCNRAEAAKVVYYIYTARNK